jgi:hypothetical protein
MLLIVQFPLAFTLGTKTLVQGPLVEAKQTVDALNLPVMNGFARRAPFLGHRIAIRFDLLVQLVEIVAGSIQNCIQGGNLLAVEFDGV